MVSSVVKCLELFIGNPFNGAFACVMQMNYDSDMFKITIKFVFAIDKIKWANKKSITWGLQKKKKYWFSSC